MHVSCFISGLSLSARYAVEVDTPASSASLASVSLVSDANVGCLSDRCYVLNTTVLHNSVLNNTVLHICWGAALPLQALY